MKNNKNNLISISPPAPPTSVPSLPESTAQVPATLASSLSSSPSPTVAVKVPEKFYPNPETSKDQILSENQNKSGVYMWKNNLNNKRYIGSAVYLSNRLRFYYSAKAIENALKNSQSYIYNALLKYGYSNFSLTILEYCSPDKCIEREKYYIDLGTEYNIIKDPTLPSMSGRKHSDESKIIMSDIKKGQKKPEGSGNPSQIIEVTDTTNNTTISYDSICEAARALNIKQSTITNYILRNQKKPYKGVYTRALLHFY